MECQAADFIYRRRFAGYNHWGRLQTVPGNCRPSEDDLLQGNCERAGRCMQRDEQQFGRRSTQGVRKRICDKRSRQKFKSGGACSHLCKICKRKACKSWRCGRGKNWQCSKNGICLRKCETGCDYLYLKTAQRKHPRGDRKD